jgi:hypothetical protein
MKIVATLIREGRPAAGVIKILAAEDAALMAAVAKLGRNELCPCGSGRKVKRCHGNPAQSGGEKRSLTSPAS